MDLGPYVGNPGKLQYVCSHDVDESIPPDEGLVFCHKVYSTATVSIPPPVAVPHHIEATTAGHAVAMATITVDESLSLPTLFQGLNGSLETSVPGSAARDVGVGLGWVGLMVSTVLFVFSSILL
jgi:hypothetical protein